jgi:hypothetical protein
VKVVEHVDSSDNMDVGDDATAPVAGGDAYPLLLPYGFWKKISTLK